ncbi:MAG TPA: glycosyltransferase family 4 protein [Xanthobacteraceae bacterium]|nr:glycosyltransferase family 4 protein [Xanthobacteraceae bacterium]
MKGYSSVNEACCLALVSDAFGGHGGIAQYNRDFLRAVAASARVASITVLPRLGPNKAIAPTKVLQQKPHFRRSVYAIAAIWHTLRLRVDIVFCGHLYMAPLAWLLARLKRAKLIMQMHGIEAWPRPTRLQRAAVEEADLILCVSRYTRGAVLKWADVVPERVVVVPNTVGEAFTPGVGRSMRESLGIDQRKVLLTVARMDAGQRYKGHERVIEAIPELVAQGHDILYMVAGEGDDRPRLEECARKARIADRIRFLGAVPPEKMIDCFRIADLYVMPSTGEGFGIAFIEAMASGTPALGLAVAGANDPLADGELGNVATNDQLAQAISHLLAAPRPDPAALSVRTRARFGGDAFRERVSMALDRAQSAA